jgi:hypothetical protein
MFGGTAEYHRKVDGSEVDCGGVVSREKSGSAGRGEARRHGGDLSEVVSEMGRVNREKITPLADRAGPQSFEA